MHTTRILAVVAAAGEATLAHGQVVSFSGDMAASSEQTGAMFSGSLEYTYLGGNDGRLSIDVTNDSPLAVGGFMTGLVFRASGDNDPLATLLASADPVSFLDLGSFHASPFGQFDGGAAVGANWLGGGDPSVGLGIGESGRFIFEISSADAGSLTSNDFIGSVDSPGMVMRFRGLEGGLSDKVPVFVPAPSALALLGMGGLMATRRRR